MNKINIRAALNEFNLRVIHYFDKIAFRTPRELTDRQLAFLRNNADSVDQRPGRPIPNSNKYLKLTIVNANDDGLEFLAKRSYLKPNYAEPALDMIVKRECEKYQLCEIFSVHFVQLYPGKHEIVLQPQHILRPTATG